MSCSRASASDKNRSGRWCPLNQATGLLVALLMLALISPGAAAQAAVGTARTVRVVMDSVYAPYSFRSGDGKLQGILIDQWQAWEKKTGIKVEIHALDWGEALGRMRAGEFDVIDSIVETPERQGYFDFTRAYATIEASIYFRKDISGITDIASLKGFPVGVKTADQHIDQLEANGVTTVVLFQNNDAIIEAAKQRKINVFVVDVPSALYLLNKSGIEGEFRQSTPIFRDELRRAVRKGDAALLRTVSEGFAAIEPRELRQIDEKWFGRTINRQGRYLAYAGYATAVAMLLTAGVAAWNRTLRRGILQRTAALGESELRFRQIAENIREVFWISTPHLESVLYVSPAYESIWGRPVESVRQHPRAFMEAIHAEDRERVVGILEGQRERGFDVEYRIVRPDGSVRWIRDRGFPVKDASGKVYRIAGVAEDITERKQAADHLRLVIDTIPTMAWSLLPDGSVDFVNQPWLKYTGLSFAEALSEANRIIHPEDLPWVMERWLADRAAEQSSEYEMRLRRADGEYRWFLVRTVPLRNERGKLFKWYGTSTDIEDRKRAEEALGDSSIQLQALSRRLVELQESERKELSRELHDRIGQSLTALNINLNILGTALPLQASDELRSRLADSKALVESTTAAIGNILSELRPPMLDEHGLALALDWYAGQVSTRAGIPVVVRNFGPGERPAPQAEIALFRIAQEALTNVVKHARASRAEITLERHESEYVMSVRDDGVGFDAVDGRTARRPGLGMVIMRERAQAVGGRFEVLAHPGSGTRLTVRVPA
jgi:PAS domain S-box-containing protein